MLSAIIFGDGGSVVSACFSHALDDSIFMFSQKENCLIATFIDKCYYCKWCCLFFLVWAWWGLQNDAEFFFLCFLRAVFQSHSDAALS